MNIFLTLCYFIKFIKKIKYTLNIHLELLNSSNKNFFVLMMTNTILLFAYCFPDTNYSKQRDVDKVAAVLLDIDYTLSLP